MIDISYQLYSSREFPPLSETLSMLKDAGYSQVEGFGGVYGDLVTLSESLKQNGLTMTSGHFSIEMLEDESDKVMEIANATGMKAIYCPHLAAEARPSDAAGWKAFGQRLQKVGALYRDAGLIFGWHNHDFEFVALDDGTMPIDAIFEGAPDISWEADVAWIERAGADAIEWIGKYGSRMSAVHIKDIATAGESKDEDGWADVGHGSMDWAGIAAAVKSTPCQFFVMEHDKPNDHERFARRSIASVKAL